MSKYPPVDPDSLTPADFLAMLDYTLLKPEEPLETYARFISKADRLGVRSIFLPPCYVPLAVGMLGNSSVVVGAPVSFPFGYAMAEAKAAEALAALEEGATELDVVMNVSAALSGEWELVAEDLGEVLSAVRQWEDTTRRGPIITKVILETPYLDKEQKVTACEVSVEAGFDFVKTATGLGPGGATVEDVRLMREVVGEDVGVKASGGVRSWEDAKAMIRAGACRIGTSAAPEIIEGSYSSLIS